MRDIWDRISARGPGWYLVANQMRNGDAYHACSLLSAFTETHGPELPIYFIAAGPAHIQVAQLYEEHIAEVILEPGLPQEPEAWHAFLREAGLPAFGPNTPILLHPMANPATCALDRFSTENGLNWMQLYKDILRLPADAASAAPKVRPEVVEHARRYCEEQAVEPMNSVLLFPYAQSLRADGLKHFGALAAELASRGLKVFTSLSVDEEAVPGTSPIFLPFPILREVAEHAGWVVAVRSGICDLVSSARCRKTFIYRNARERALWSVNRMDLSRDAVEEVFSFVWQTPERFCDLVCGPPGPPFPKARPPLSDLLARDAPAGRLVSVSFSQLEQGARSLAFSTESLLDPLSGAAYILRVTDVPPRKDPRWAGVVEDVLSEASATAVSESGAVFACKDDAGEFDFLEEIDVPAALGGHYVNGRRWHSLLFDRGRSLRERLPVDARECVLPLEPLAVRRKIPVVGRHDPANYAAYLSGRRPFSSSGIQLLGGWYEPEPWGAWSRDRRCAFKFALAEPPRDGFTLVLGCHAAISPGFPELRYAVQVNDRDVGGGTIKLSSNGQALKIGVPAEAVRGCAFLIEIRFEEVRSPADQGAAPDGRLLGVAFKWIQVQPPGFRERLRRAASESSRLSLAGAPVLESGRAPDRPWRTAARP